MKLEIDQVLKLFEDYKFPYSAVFEAGRLYGVGGKPALAKFLGQVLEIMQEEARDA